MIETLLRCGSFVLQIFRNLKSQDKERKKEIADALVSISQLLYSVAGALKQDQYPQGSCEAMQDLSQHLLDKIEDVIPRDTAARLADQLKEVSNMERLYGIRDDKVIREIESTAGRFYSASILIKL